ncbi:hypothetical protein Moror_13036 [Moniliophthora roreri MCA 2997]|uniref:Uncharacterized protein n=2 Tax=Moniliophthora roreri TaxID=221103 RepID=V2X3Z1_MONRO|nr:hypothetical protein Moror_13036 [Moniliophthora roreri MCA 2997]
MQEQLSSVPIANSDEESQRQVRVDYDRASSPDYTLQYPDIESPINAGPETSPGLPSSPVAFLRDLYTRFASSLQPIDLTTALESITKFEYLANEALSVSQAARICVEGLIRANEAREATWNEFKAELEGYLEQQVSSADDDIDMSDSTQSATDDEDRLQAEENIQLQQLKETEESARQDRALGEEKIFEARQGRERVRREKKEEAERKRKDAEEQRQLAKEQERLRKEERAAQVEEQCKAAERSAKEEQRRRAAAEAQRALEAKREQQQITINEGHRRGLDIQSKQVQDSETLRSSPAAESGLVRIRALTSISNGERLSSPRPPDPDSSMLISESPCISERASRIQKPEIPARSSSGEREPIHFSITTIKTSASKTLSLPLDAESLSPIPIPATALPLRSVNPVAERTLFPIFAEPNKQKKDREVELDPEATLPSSPHLHLDNGVSPTSTPLREERGSSIAAMRSESSSPSPLIYPVNAGTGDLGHPLEFELVIEDVPASVLEGLDLATTPPNTIANESLNLATATSTSTPIPHGQDPNSQMSQSQSTEDGPSPAPDDLNHYSPPHVSLPQPEIQAENLTSPSMSTSLKPAATAAAVTDAQPTHTRTQGDEQDSGFQPQSVPEHGRDMKIVPVSSIDSPLSLLQPQPQSSGNSTSTPHAPTQSDGQLQRSVDLDHNWTPATEQISIPYTTHIHTRNSNFQSSVPSQPEHDQGDPSPKPKPRNQSQALIKPPRCIPEVYDEDLCGLKLSSRLSSPPPDEASPQPGCSAMLSSPGTWKKRTREDDDERNSRRHSPPGDRQRARKPCSKYERRRDRGRTVPQSQQQWFPESRSQIHDDTSAYHRNRDPRGGKEVQQLGDHVIEW